MDLADIPFVYFNPHAIKLKKLPQLEKGQVKEAFGNDKISVFDNSQLMAETIKTEAKKCLEENIPYVILMMSSGNFNGINLLELKIEN
jgi:UDP-N-acetylmuramate: L-alanyl-gamma-D-glutamyl-meso-diaminopimelate ligase